MSNKHVNLVHIKTKNNLNHRKMCWRTQDNWNWKWYYCELLCHMVWLKCTFCPYLILQLW